jgi:CO/xanthine dehydrogenase FAD-binding subunit
MRTALSTLEVVRPRTLDDALAAMASANSDRPVPLAGGTDLFVYLNAGTPPGTRYLDLWDLDELRGIQVEREGLRFGALTTFRDVREHPIVRRRLASLASAAGEVGGWQIQNRATMAGNIANASPAGDSLPVLLSLDAQVEARSVRGTRSIAFAELYRGYRTLALDRDELITAVRVPFPARGAHTFFRKVGTRSAQSISKVVLAAVASVERGTLAGVRLAYGSVAPVTIRARNAEAALEGRKRSSDAVATAREALARDIAPIDDIRSSREYRVAVSGNLLEQFMRSLGAF